MTQVLLPHRPVDSNEVQDNLEAILRVLNSDLRDDNVSDAAQIRLGKLAPGNNGQIAITQTIGGKKEARWADTSTSGVGGIGYDSDHIGTVKAFSGQTVPTDWMVAAGQSLDRTAYSELFAVIGTIFGAVDSTHFSLPNLTSQFIYGAAANLSDIGAAGGEAAHQLVAAEIPTHDHGLAGNHFHTPATQPWFAVTAATNVALGTGGPSRTLITGTEGTADAGAHTHTPFGSNGSHNNIPPYVKMALIIKVKGAQILPGSELIGPPGPPGPSGTGGDKNYVHNQVPLASTWTVAHMLGKFPTVAVVDSGNSVILPDIAYVDNNNLTLTFGAATSGKAYVN
jgi:microcystin-dependent protein